VNVPAGLQHRGPVFGNMRSKGAVGGLELADMITVYEIREHLVDLLDPKVKKEEALSSFEDWFVQASWNMHQDSDSQAQRFAAEIELALAENESDLDILWSRLKDILRSNPPVADNSETVKITTGSSTTTQRACMWGHCASQGESDAA
jgi:hypothetical protein